MKDISEVDLTYYGLSKPTKDNFRNVIPEDTKCGGGLWTSPILEGETKSEWCKWCENANWEPAPHRWHIIPDEDCRILVVDEDLTNLTQYLRRGKILAPKILDYEKIAKDYDAIYVPDSVQRRYRRYDQVFCGFDVETCLFLRPKFTALTDAEYEQYRKNKSSNNSGLTKEQLHSLTSLKDRNR